MIRISSVPGDLLHCDYDDFIHAHLRHDECDKTILFLKIQFEVSPAFGANEGDSFDPAPGGQTQADRDIFNRIIGIVVY